MPTKRNKAGQQQNYVPQGNGDASGEYADQASGSNKHFTNFKKPDEQAENVKSDLTKTEQPKEDTSKYSGGSKTKSEFSAGIQARGFNDYKYGEGAVKNFQEVIANANEDCIGIIDHSFQNHRVDFIRDDKNGSYYNKARDEINVDPKDLDRAFEEKGEAVFHEIGHYLNAQNTIREEHGWRSESLPLVEAHVLFKDDYKSVAETLQEEIKEFAAAKHAPRIRKERSKYLNERLKQYGFTCEEFERNIKKSKDILASDAEWLDIKDRVVNDWQNGRFESREEANKKLREELMNWKENGSYKDLFTAIEYQRPYFRKYQDEWGKLTGIKAVSDVWSSKSDFGFGYGHPRTYYNKSWNNPNPENLVADELWANTFASLTTNNQASLETTKKYFPRTYEKMLKLVDYLKDKRTKYLNMKSEIEKFQNGEAI